MCSKHWYTQSFQFLVYINETLLWCTWSSMELSTSSATWTSLRLARISCPLVASSPSSYVSSSFSSGLVGAGNPKVWHVKFEVSMSVRGLTVLCLHYLSLDGATKGLQGTEGEIDSTDAALPQMQHLIVRTITGKHVTELPLHVKDGDFCKRRATLHHPINHLLLLLLGMSHVLRH